MPHALRFAFHASRITIYLSSFVLRRLSFVVLIAAVGAFVLAIGGIGVALVLENQDPFCAACHTQPEVTYFQQSIQPQSTTLAAFHAQKQTACIDCHSGSGLLGRSKGLQQGAHDLLNYLVGSYHRPAVTTNPLGDDSCVKCHGDVLNQTRAGSRAMNGHYHQFLPRWQELDSNAAHCTTCHTAHANSLASLAFMAQGKVGQVCDQCHTALSGREPGRETQ